MCKYIEAPTEYEPIPNTPSIFLAGGITNCSDWQKELVSYLETEKVVLINPRRKDFDVSNPNMEREQIEWEHRHLNKVDIISFWFPPETLCPITLFELADAVAMSQTKENLKIFVGCHPDYKRIRDVKIQLGLRDSSIHVVESLKALHHQIRDHLCAVKS